MTRFIHTTLSLGILSLVPFIGGAQTPQEAAKAKLEAAIAELAEVRSTIQEEKEPLASRMRALENDVLELRQERERMERLVDNQSVAVSDLENQVEAFDDEATYVVNLLNDFYNRINASLTVAEIPLYQGELLELINAGSDESLENSAKLDVLVPNLDLALGRIEELVGGMRFAGQAIMPTGELVEGDFALIGPITYFAANEGPAGLVVRGSSERPALIDFDPGAQPAIASLVETGEATLPMDVTLGRALAIKTSEETLQEHFMKGGLWMWPIAFFAFVAVVIGLYKLGQILSTKEVGEDSLEKILDHVQKKEYGEAMQIARDLPDPGSQMLQTGLNNRHLPKELLEEFLYEVLLDVKPKLERGIPFIALTAAVAPLLGLLGTVTGMIETFKLLELFGSGDARSLSSGISEALITTEFGLVAAIPALILSAIVGRMAAGKLVRFEKLLLAFSNGLAAIKAGGPRTVEETTAQS